MLKIRVKRSVGQTLVEFALVLPVLILIVMGVFEFGRMLQAWLTVQNSAQAAARYATTGQHSVAPAVDQWDSVRLAAIKAEALRKAVSLSINNSAGASSAGYFHVNVYASDTPVQGAEYPGGPNARVAVDVIYNHPLITPLINMIAPYVTLRAHSEMINERFRHPGYGTPVGVLPPTIFPTPEPTNTPPATPTSTLQPINTATGLAPTDTATSNVTSTPIRTATITQAPTETTIASGTPIPSNTPVPTNTPVSTVCPPCGVWGYPSCPPGCRRRTATPEPTNTPVPTNTPRPTNTPVPTNTPRPTNTLVPTSTPIPYCPWWCFLNPSNPACSECP